MTVGVELSGLPQLEARLLHASSGVMDLSDANRDIAKAVESQARPDAPRATGRLAGSDTITVTADSWSISQHPALCSASALGHQVHEGQALAGHSCTRH